MRYEEYLRNEVVREADMERRIQTVKDRLRNDPRLARDHTWHSEKDLESFLDTYASRVFETAVPKGPDVPAPLTPADVQIDEQWSEKVEKAYLKRLIWPILQKKAFDLQCRWVAGEADLPHHITSAHFAYWDRFPDIVDAMGHITDRDFDTYLRFRATEPRRPSQFTKELIEQGDQALRGYHAYRSLCQPDPGSLIPEWFDFHDAEYGTAHLRHLPNLRADMEQDHLDIHTEQVLMPTLDPYQRAVLRHRDRATRQRMATDPDFATEVATREQEAIEKASPIGKEYQRYDPFDKDFMSKVLAALCTEEETQTHERLLFLAEAQALYFELMSKAAFLISLSPPGPVDDHPDAVEVLRETYDVARFERDSEMLLPCYEAYLDARFARQSPPPAVPAVPELDERTGRILAARRHLGQPEDLLFLHNAH